MACKFRRPSLLALTLACWALKSGQTNKSAQGRTFKPHHPAWNKFFDSVFFHEVYVSIWQNASLSLMHHWWYCKVDWNQEELSWCSRVQGSSGVFLLALGSSGEFRGVLGSIKHRVYHFYEPPHSSTGLYWFNSRSVHDIDIRWQQRIMCRIILLWQHQTPRRHFEYVCCLDQRF